MRPLTISSPLLSLLIVASCASRPAAPSARAPTKLAWHGGTHAPYALVTIDLRDCSAVLERADRMPRSGRFDASECRSLADAARRLRRVVPPDDCPVAKPILPSFVVAFEDGDRIGGPRCAVDHRDERDAELLTALARVVEARGPALAASGATPPGECDPVACRPDAGSGGSEYEFDSDDGRKCMRDASGSCAFVGGSR